MTNEQKQAMLRPHVGVKLDKSLRVGDVRPSATITVGGARMHDADIRLVDDKGFERHFMGRNERYLWEQVLDITTTTVTI